MSKIYQGGADKLVGTLTIIGDPDFITQDEGFGLHAHSSLYVRNSVNTHRDPVILINFLTPPDIDTETGLLATHSGDSQTHGNSISIFSGYYRVLIISSTISDNVFRQELSLVRVEVQEEQELKQTESTQEIDIKKKAPDPKIENASQQFLKNYNYNKIAQTKGSEFTVADDNKNSSSSAPIITVDNGIIKVDHQTKKYRDPNYPEEHFVANEGGTFIDLGNPWFYENPHRDDLK
tara:strand:- start:1269 stop:1973 length:705 start_codon:yes stop_codon:yes gene_type:complete